MTIIQEISCFIADNRIAFISLAVSLVTLTFTYKAHQRHRASLKFVLHKFSSFHKNKDINNFQQSYIYLYITIVNDSQLPNELMSVSLDTYAPIYRFFRNLRIGNNNIVPYSLLKKRTKPCNTYLFDLNNQFPQSDDCTLTDSHPLFIKGSRKNIRLDAYAEINGHICFYSSATHNKKPLKLYLNIDTSRKLFKHKIVIQYNHTN
jgi:hypothetical protein